MTDQANSAEAARLAGTGREGGVIGGVLSHVARPILSGALGPGDRLANETDMMAELGVSRTAVREAIKILSGKGLVETRRRHGTRVQVRERWNLLDHDVLGWMMASASPGAFIRDLLEMRRIFEPAAAGLAAERASEVDLAVLGAACATMEASDIDADGFVQADAAFHEAVLVAAHNQFMIVLANSIRASLIVFLRHTTEDPDVFERGRPYHRAVFAKIAARDADGARAAMHDLLDGAQQFVDRIAARRATPGRDTAPLL